MNYCYLSHSEEETMLIAKKLASKLTNSDTIVLCGDLGSGKTKFTEGFLSYFHLENEISSPTFTIVNEYKTDKINIYHFDVYRLHSIDEFYAIGGPDYFEEGICIIEWGELIQDALPPNYIKITFHRDNKNEKLRRLDFELIGNKYDSTFLGGLYENISH